MNFKTFFENNSIANIKLASNPRHRTEAGITNQKTNIVARYLSPHNDYKNQSVVGANYNSGNRPIKTKSTKKLTKYENTECVNTVNKEVIKSPKLRVIGYRPLNWICLEISIHEIRRISEINKFNPRACL